MKLLLRRLEPADATAFRRLRLQGLREAPAAFGSSFEEERAMTVDLFEKRLEQTADKWVFGAFFGTKLIGIVTLLREAQLKSRHKAGVYGMYVAPSFRRLGIGRTLLTLTLDTADRLPGLRQIRLSVGSSNRAALKLYQSLGFSEYGRERDALYVDGRFLAESLLVLRLKRRRPKRPETTREAAPSG